MTDRQFPINTHLTGELEWLNHRPVFASISGGKDSAALGLYLQDSGVAFTPLFLDTGWEADSTYEYIHDVLVPQFGEFLVLRNEKLFDAELEEQGWRGGMEQAIYRNNMFPSGMAKFCTRLLKVEPIQNFYAELRARTRVKPVNIVGVRAEESRKRAQMSEIEEQDEATVWRPLLTWTEDQVIEYHSKHKLPPNPLYVLGNSRVGCYPCIYARKHELRHLSYSNPARIDHIGALERRINEIRGEGKKLASFFRSRRKDGDYMDITKQVEWSRTSRKGEYLDDQDELEEEGCMRWGLCERPKSEPTQPGLFDDL
jgi:3'-phosphoadenosine 5'-phosphosulfate sulfotransferase (PAPS reductase)/FAD synthetase